MRSLPLGINNERRLKSLTGLNYKKYEILLSKFTTIYNQQTERTSHKKERKRQLGGGRKSKLSSIEMKLLFVLYYLKAYPTFDLLGDRFDMASSTANKQLHKLMPILEMTLTKLEVMPKRSFETPVTLKTYLEAQGGVEKLLIPKYRD